MCRQAVESSGGPSDIDCRHIADLLGDYLDGSLPRHPRELIDFHIDRCPPCGAFINTYRGTIDARVAECESCGASDAVLSRDPALLAEQGFDRRGRSAGWLRTPSHFTTAL